MGTDASDLDLRPRVRLGDHAGEQVDFVGVRLRDEHFRVGETSLLQRADAASAALDDLGVEMPFEFLTALSVLLDDGDLIAFSNQARGDEGGTLAPSGKENAHASGRPIL